jgi:hypothetical protein
VAIDGLTIAQGNGVGVPVVDPLFGPIRAGGGILNDGATVTLSRMAFVGNQVLAPGVAEGGAVANFNGGRLTVEDSTFSENLASSAIAFGAGGAIASANGSALTVRASTLSGNRSTGGIIAIGGAISVHNGTATVEGSQFIGNQARDATGDRCCGRPGLGGAIQHRQCLLDDRGQFLPGQRGPRRGRWERGARGAQGRWQAGAVPIRGFHFANPAGYGDCRQPVCLEPGGRRRRRGWWGRRAGGNGGHGVGGALDAAGGTMTSATAAWSSTRRWAAPAEIPGRAA